MIRNAIRPIDGVKRAGDQVNSIMEQIRLDILGMLVSNVHKPEISQKSELSSPTPHLRNHDQ